MPPGTAAPQPPSFGPSSASERIHALDAMRGVAILGVLFAYTIWNLGAPPQETWSKTDLAIARAMDLFVDNKFLTMFACLFGVGIAQQWRRWEAAGHDPVLLHLRRMGFLLGFGLLHAVLLRNGDILAPYALLGLLLLAFRRASNRTILVIAALLVFVPYVLRAMPFTWPHRPSGAPGHYWADNWAWLRYWYVTNPFNSWPLMLAIMLAGFVIGRAGVVERLATSRASASRVLGVALALAVLTRAMLMTLGARWDSPAPWQRLALSFLFEVTSWTLAATYGAALLLLMQSATWVARLWPLRAVGRMAFTNYMVQALIVVPLCLAFGLFDTMTPVRGLWLAVAIAILQFIYSTWWLGRFRMGPFERLWRGFTYGPRHVSPGAEARPAAP